MRLRINSPRFRDSGGLMVEDGMDVLEFDVDKELPSSHDCIRMFSINGNLIPVRAKAVVEVIDLAEVAMLIPTGKESDWLAIIREMIMTCQMQAINIDKLRIRVDVWEDITSNINIGSILSPPTLRLYGCPVQIVTNGEPIEVVEVEKPDLSDHEGRREAAIMDAETKLPPVENYRPGQSIRFNYLDEPPTPVSDLSMDSPMPCPELRFSTLTYRLELTPSPKWVLIDG